jgi:hypothetical protein
VDRIHRLRTAEVATTRHATVIPRDRALRPHIGIPARQTTDLLRLRTGIPARPIEDRLRYTVAVPPRMVVARRHIGRHLLTEADRHRTDLRLRMAAVPRHTARHRPTGAAPIAAAEEAVRLSRTAAAVEVDLAAGVVGTAAVDVLRPADMEVIAN